MLIAWIVLIPLYCCGAVVEDFYDVWYLQIGSEWTSYEDNSQVVWSDEAWTVDVNRTDLRNLASLPGVDADIARRIIADREKRGSFIDIDDLTMRTGIRKARLSGLEGLVSFGGKLYEARYHARANRRYGPDTNDDIERYDGSPFGMTQRLSLSTGSIKAGAMLDKDRFEPSIADISRYFISYRSKYLSAVVGDFNVSSGYGVALRTRQVYLTGFDVAAAYDMNRCGIRPATETQENSAFRGLGIDMDIERLHISLFGASTALDAIVDDEDRVLRLSNTGLHRTEGESRKKDTARERAFGCLMRYDLSVGEEAELVLFLSGYHSGYDPRLTPEVSARQRFPLSGDEAGAAGFGCEYSHGEHRLGAEIGSDYDGHCAWRAVYSRGSDRTLDWDFRSTLYHYPADYHNPRAGPPSSGSSADNRTGAAVMFGGKCQLGPVERFSTHIEVERRPWRTYTVPRPLSSTRGSLELGCPLFRYSDLNIRYRRRSGTEGHGEEAVPNDFTEDKLRLTWLGETKADTPLDRYRIWIEAGYGKEEGEADSDGVAGGVRLSGKLNWLSIFLRDVRLSLSSSLFSTSGSLPLYIGEADLPDRLSSVRLSGHGLRLTGALTWRTSRTRWLAAEVARTVRTDDPDLSGDLEAYLTLSFYLSHLYNSRSREVNR